MWCSKHKQVLCEFTRSETWLITGQTLEMEKKFFDIQHFPFVELENITTLCWTLQVRIMYLPRVLLMGLLELHIYKLHFGSYKAAKLRSIHQFKLLVVHHKYQYAKYNILYSILFRISSIYITRTEID